MEEYYKKSLQKIRELGQVLSAKEWNKLAMTEGYLSAESMQYISGKSVRRLCKRAIKGRL